MYRKKSSLSTPPPFLRDRCDRLAGLTAVGRRQHRTRKMTAEMERRKGGRRHRLVSLLRHTLVALGNGYLVCGLTYR